MFLEPSRCLNFLATFPSLGVPDLILMPCLYFLYLVAFQIFFLRLPLCSSVYLVLNSSLRFLYPVAFKIVFLRLPLSISLSLILPSLCCTLSLCTTSFYVSLVLSPWPYLLVLAYVSGTLLLFEVQLPVSVFYFLLTFFSPIALGFFPLPCLVSAFLSCWSLPPLSPASSLSYLFLPRSVPAFLLSLSALLSLPPCPAPCPSLVRSIPFPGSLSQSSTSLCPSSCFSLPFSPSVLLPLGTEPCSQLSAGISYVP